MTYFTKRLYTYFGDSEFIFNRSMSAEAARYHVSVRNGEGRALHFTMEKREEGWRITNAPAIPDWVRQSEMLLSEEIARRN